VTVDPLDGSSNIDVNATIGTIFGILRRQSPEGQQATVDDVLRTGRDLVAAGYIIYGSGTVLVLATELGVNGFTLDPTVGEFFLSHPNIRIPDRCGIYSVNEGYAAHWQPGVLEFVSRMKDAERKTTARYIGSLVADFHRNLLKGGVFVYPATTKSPQGKLRLLYEGFPLAFVAEKAGGRATDGRVDILDRVAASLHERTPLVIGNAAEVAEATALMSKDPHLG
jgi:fructose-1,6-bisphosphatase I